MRVRLQTNSSNLPELKAWFSFPPTHDNEQDYPSKVLDFKKSICKSVKILHEAKARFRDIVCELDGFELLDELDIFGVLREGDLVVIKTKEEGPVVGQKRKAQDMGDNGNAKRRKAIRTIPSPEKNASTEMGENVNVQRRRSMRMLPAREQSESSAVSTTTDSSTSDSDVTPKRRSAKRTIPPPKKSGLTAVDSSTSDSDYHYQSDTGSSSSSSSDEESSDRPRPQSDEESSDSSSSSESDSSSDEESSDSSLSSSSSSPPSVDTSKLNTRAPPKQTSNIKLTDLRFEFVPPGQGSIQTQKRNVRRRLKKKHDGVVKGQSPLPKPTSVAPPKHTSSVNAAPLGSRSVSQANADHSRQTNISMFSLGNKNKKKGFKHALVMPTTGKKVFGEDASQDISTAAAATSGHAESASTEDLSMQDALNAPLPPSTAIFTDPAVPSSSSRDVRLVPPSEQQDMGVLPRNMFVTSIDVEEGISAWGKKKERKKQKQGRKDPAQANGVDSYIPFAGSQEVGYSQRAASNSGTRTNHIAKKSPGNRPEKADAAYDEDIVVLDYGDDVGVESEDSKAFLIWTVAEEQFDSSEVVAILDQLSVGMLVGWKDLGINPSTFTPEVLLHLATVVGKSADERTVSVQKLVRPGGEELAEDLDVTFEWDEVIRMSWKVLDSIQRR